MSSDPSPAEKALAEFFAAMLTGLVFLASMFVLFLLAELALNGAGVYALAIVIVCLWFANRTGSTNPLARFQRIIKAWLIRHFNSPHS